VTVSDEKQELAKSSNELLEDLRALRRLEGQKREEAISSDQFHELADEVTSTSRKIMKTVLKQDELGESAERGDESIEDIVEAGGTG
jgi:sugar-specific transcriptional regulator TrmB